AAKVPAEQRFGATAARIEAAIAALEAATTWLLDAQANGRTAEALAGATVYQPQLGLTLTGIYLAKAGLAETADGGRAALARFFAENLLPETAALGDSIVHGAGSLAAARSLLAGD